MILKEIEGGYEVKGVEILSGEAIIPSEYNGKPVIRIGESAFEGRNDLTKVIIPAGVKEIGRYAFGQCGSLKEVVLSEGLESIGEHAFFGCYAIKRLEIPVSVTSVGEGAFEYWRQDQTIVVCGDFGRPPLGWSPNWLGKQGDPVLDWYYA
ncbi:MAG: leucine-rich repeat domain-containing protein [Clostridiales bacterium]|nr:leucine-rich repeat domain-containing protein [Clostridiales bacterium]